MDIATPHDVLGDRLRRSGISDSPTCHSDKYCILLRGHISDSGSVHPACLRTMWVVEAPLPALDEYEEATRG
jgi:hypothetical protein